MALYNITQHIWRMLHDTSSKMQVTLGWKALNWGLKSHTLSRVDHTWRFVIGCNVHVKQFCKSQQKNTSLDSKGTALSPNKKNPRLTISPSKSLCPVDSRQFHHREGRPPDLRLPLPFPRSPCCPLDSPMSIPATMFPRSAVEQRRILSLANPICSTGMVTFKGSTSSWSGRGQAAKMQSIGCQSGTEYFKSRSHLKLGFESQPLHFFDRFLAVEVGVHHCTSIWRGCSPLIAKLGPDKARQTQMGLPISCYWGRNISMCPSCTLSAMRKAAAGRRFAGPT